MNKIKPNLWDEVHEIIRMIPPGKVMNYGQIAEMLSRPVTPRTVGWALRDCPEDLPWHRVVNAQGGCSTDSAAGSEPGRQQARLEAEGVRFGEARRLSMSRYRWDPLDDLGD